MSAEAPDKPSEAALVVTLTVAALRAVIADAVADALADLDAVGPDEPLTVSGSEMAHRLGISRTALYKLRTRDGCPAMKVGDHYRYKPDAVLAWLEQRGSK